MRLTESRLRSIIREELEADAARADFDALLSLYQQINRLFGPREGQTVVDSLRALRPQSQAFPSVQARVEAILEVLADVDGANNPAYGPEALGVDGLLAKLLRHIRHELNPYRQPASATAV